jgi:hypothetical protein
MRKWHPVWDRRELKLVVALLWLSLAGVMLSFYALALSGSIIWAVVACLFGLAMVWIYMKVLRGVFKQLGAYNIPQNLLGLMKLWSEQT